MSNINLLVEEGMKEHFKKHGSKYAIGALALGAAGTGGFLAHKYNMASKPAFSISNDGQINLNAPKAKEEALDKLKDLEKNLDDKTGGKLSDTKNKIGDFAKQFMK